VTSADTLPALLQATTGKHIAALDDPSSDSELVPMISDQHQEEPVMSDPNSRTTVPFALVKELAEAHGVPFNDGKHALVAALEYRKNCGSSENRQAVIESLTLEEVYHALHKMMDERA
jgi:hypothetical protein